MNKEVRRRARSAPGTRFNRILKLSRASRRRGTRPDGRQEDAQNGHFGITKAVPELADMIGWRLDSEGSPNPRSSSLACRLKGKLPPSAVSCAAPGRGSLCEKERTDRAGIVSTEGGCGWLGLALDGSAPIKRFAHRKLGDARPHKGTALHPVPFGQRVASRLSPQLTYTRYLPLPSITHTRSRTISVHC